jgi:aspartate/methionine/tyrosine aminotransferase
MQKKRVAADDEGGSKEGIEKYAGVKIKVSFGAGEPDFNTPDTICYAAINAICGGFTKYTPSAGIPELKKAVANKFEVENGLKYSPDQVVVSCGAKHSVYNTMQVLLDPGDEVILIAPYWMTYADQIRLAGGVPKVVHTTSDSGFVPTIDQLKEAIGPKTKAILVNSPSNPTGAVLPRETLKEIAALALRHSLWVIADEIYEHLLYDGEKHTSIASLGKEIFEQTIQHRLRFDGFARIKQRLDRFLHGLHDGRGIAPAGRHGLHACFHALHLGREPLPHVGDLMRNDGHEHADDGQGNGDQEFRFCFHCVL